MERAGLAAIVLSVVAVALVATALMLTFTDRSDEEPGRVLTIDVSQRAPLRPELFGSDDFYLVRTDVSWEALYVVVPHVVFGLHRGCRLEWMPDEIYEDDSRVVRGVFADPCSGSKFAIDGSRLFGPSPRGLDKFLVYQESGASDLIVDTRILLCDVSGAELPCQRTVAD